MACRSRDRAKLHDRVFILYPDNMYRETRWGACTQREQALESRSRKRFLPRPRLDAIGTLVHTCIMYIEQYECNGTVLWNVCNATCSACKLRLRKDVEKGQPLIVVAERRRVIARNGLQEKKCALHDIYTAACTLLTVRIF